MKKFIDYARENKEVLVNVSRLGSSVDVDAEKFAKMLKSFSSTEDDYNQLLRFIDNFSKAPQDTVRCLDKLISSRKIDLIDAMSVADVFLSALSKNNK